MGQDVDKVYIFYSMFTHRPPASHRQWTQDPHQNPKKIVRSIHLLQRLENTNSVKKEKQTKIFFWTLFCCEAGLPPDSRHLYGGVLVHRSYYQVF